MAEIPAGDYVVLDTRAFDKAIAMRSDLARAYEDINDEYDRIVKDLLKDWKGAGADAFKKDAKTVKTNIVGIFDILKSMCDMLEDCREVFAECDRGLGEYNRSAANQELKVEKV